MKKERSYHAGDEIPASSPKSHWLKAISVGCENMRRPSLSKDLALSDSAFRVAAPFHEFSGDVLGKISLGGIRGELDS